MTPSADDIFAAQFWAWPDPAIKRDAHGRVLFVNAAFLQLFGGSVQDWQGQTVQGWNPPQPGPQPYRFELRIPGNEAYPEQVYDWVEACGQDGSGFALARNVTPFLQMPAAQPVQPAQNENTAPAQTFAASQSFDTSLPQQSQEPSQAPAAPPVATQQPAQAPAQTDIPVAPPAAASHAPQAAQSDDIPVAEPVVAPPVEVERSVEVASSNVVEVNPHEIAADTASYAEQSQAITAHAVGANTMPTSGYSEAKEERDFERRALPIENGDTVLGNNWRDAVIAKAVGGKDGEESLLPGLAPEPSPSASGAKPDAIRILLAEDNAINALLTRTLLEADGHTVETVEDGALAVEAMKTKEFDMIFMDMRMPNMDGLESTRKIRALPNVSKDLPIVALTANAFDDDRNACFDSGMNDFMTKPVSAEELSEMVLRWTSSSSEKKMAS